uniref:Uncharacterized protein n=1 Tax=Pelusios castaneus TaxID=367368 RepID=A0A8C8RMN8_9SAUR
MALPPPTPHSLPRAWADPPPLPWAPHCLSRPPPYLAGGAERGPMSDPRPGHSHPEPCMEDAQGGRLEKAPAWLELPRHPVGQIPAPGGLDSGPRAVGWTSQHYPLTPLLGHPSCFSTDFLPVHASTCGEDDSLSDDAWPPPPWEDSGREGSPAAQVPCPICESQFSAAEVERHASTCGEQTGASAFLPALIASTFH